jgi:phthiocerol/phenolphthiocerol synthesis type-I polyketide synthase E
VDPAVQALIEAASRTKWTRPRIPFFSCTTGELVEEPGVVDARYWGAHLRNVVRFADGVSELLRKWGPIFLEVGPGRALTGFAGAQRASQADVSAVASLPKGSCNDRKALLRVLGTLWSHGASVDWHQFHDAEPRRKVALPTYPFERQPFRMAANGSQSRRGGSESRDESQPPARWFYTPSWKIQQPLCPAEGRPANRRWLVFVNESDFGRSLLSSLRAACGNVVAVFPGEKYVRTAFDSFRIRPGRDEDYGRLLTECAPSGDRISDVLHCWSALHPGGRGPQAAAFEEAQEWGYFSVLSLVQAMCGSETRSEWSMLVVTRGLQCVLQGDGGFAAQAPVSALCKVVAQEFAGAQCCALDIPECMNPDSDGIELRQCVVAIVSESMADRYEPEVALRAGRRFVRTHEPLQLASGNRPARSLRTHGTYVITGGLGRVGLAIAERLAREVRANLVLIGRSRFPPREKWKQIAGQTARTDAEASKVRRLLEMESVGASVLVLSADVSEGAELTCAFAEAEARFGPAHGVFHLAAETQHPSGVRLLRRMDRPAVEVQTRPKVLGFCTLAGVLQERCPDFVVSFSSNASILGGMGFGAYAAANAFLDHIAFSMESNGPCFWMTTNWDEWTSSSGSESGSALPNPFAISMEEGVDALLSVVSAATVPQVIVSRRSLDVRVNRWLRQRTAVERVAEKSVGDEVKPAAREGTRVRPRNALERTIAEVWEELLGISDVGVEDDFMGLGGDSLVALRVVSRLYEAFGVSIPIRTLVEAPATITRVAVEVVSKLSSLQDAALVEEHLEQAEAAQREKYAECR